MDFGERFDKSWRVPDIHLRLFIDLFRDGESFPQISSAPCGTNGGGILDSPEGALQLSRVEEFIDIFQKLHRLFIMDDDGGGCSEARTHVLP